MTKDEIAIRYGLSDLATFLMGNEEPENVARLIWHENLLKATDHIPNKMIEAFYETMAGLTLTSFLADMFGFIRTVYAEYKPILDVRTECRMEINRLERIRRNEING